MSKAADLGEAEIWGSYLGKSVENGFIFPIVEKLHIDKK